MTGNIVAFVFIQTGVHDAQAPNLLARMPEVEELHRVAGEDCFVIRVRAATTQELDSLIRNKIERIRSVHSTRTTLVLKTFKERSASRIRKTKQA